MSEEFIRCPECGNLNILGSTRCVFCDNALDENLSKTKSTTTAVPEVPDTSIDDSISGPTVEEDKEKISLPKIPDISLTYKKEKEEVLIEDVEKSETFGINKFFMIPLYSFLVALVHYLLNLLISTISVRIEDPNVDVFPFTGDLNQYIAINAVSIILGIPFAIAVGYLLGKIIRRYTTKKSEVVIWFISAVLLDLIINIGITIVLVYAFDALNTNDILFLKLTGAAFIYLGVSVITLFLPMISGSFLMYNKIDKLFFPRNYTDY